MAFIIREAKEKDAQQIFGFIYELADYEKRRSDVTATPCVVKSALIIWYFHNPEVSG